MTAEDCAKSHALDLIETRQPNDFSKALVKKKEFKKFNKKSLICLKEGQIEKRIVN
ncbi:hypothetical protein CWI38_0902p0010 [Hamiltosporidium tvaerminnensis]|uniref:Uncharacterized protein n=1 Tax=Hamiltosporidium tvaerminnensis TaxID=1176355 RepID=A0A4V2JXJ7_9MICR|nr:hypothetical protein CWI38_0902p0010 [Hamiltosporidium tvaerminnensis]